MWGSGLQASCARRHWKPELKSLCLEMDEWYTWCAGAGRQGGDTAWGGPRLLLRETNGHEITLIIPMALIESIRCSSIKKMSSNSKPPCCISTSFAMWLLHPLLSMIRVFHQSWNWDGLMTCSGHGRMANMMQARAWKTLMHWRLLSRLSWELCYHGNNTQLAH